MNGSIVHGTKATNMDAAEAELELLVKHQPLLPSQTCE